MAYSAVYGGHLIRVFELSLTNSLFNEVKNTMTQFHTAFLSGLSSFVEVGRGLCYHYIEYAGLSNNRTESEMRVYKSTDVVCFKRKQEVHTNTFHNAQKITDN